MLDPKIISDAEERMKKSVEVFKKDLLGIRTGRATPAILDRVQVEAYGSTCPISQVANITVPDPRSNVIQPWDKSVLGSIDKAIQKSDIGIHPVNDGNIIRLSIPPLTGERRKELTKVVRKKAEDGKVSLRNIRRDVNDELKKQKKVSSASEDEIKTATDKVQKLTDKYIKVFDEIATSKEKEITEG
jgi:ribosome recycling factor